MGLLVDVKLRMKLRTVMGWPTPQRIDQRVKPISRFSVSLKESFSALNQGLQVYI